MWMHIVHSLLNVPLNILQNKAVLILPLFCYRAQCVSALKHLRLFLCFCTTQMGEWESPFAWSCTLVCCAVLWLCWTGQQRAHREAWEADGREGSWTRSCYRWKSTFPRLSQPKISVNILSWNIREERLKRSTVIILEAGESCAKTVLDLSSGQFSFCSSGRRTECEMQTVFHSHHTNCRDRSAELSNKFRSTVSTMTDSWGFFWCIVRKSSLLLLRHVGPIKLGVFKL